MRLLCLHADTVQALQRLGTSVDDLTPQGLWDTPFHLVRGDDDADLAPLATAPTTPELVRLRAGATGNNTTTFVGDDGPNYIALS